MVSSFRCSSPAHFYSSKSSQTTTAKSRIPSNIYPHISALSVVPLAHPVIVHILESFAVRFPSQAAQILLQHLPVLVRSTQYQHGQRDIVESAAAMKEGYCAAEVQKQSWCFSGVHRPEVRETVWRHSRSLRLPRS